VHLKAGAVGLKAPSFRVAIRLWLCLWIVLFTLYLTPVASRTTRLILLATVFQIWLGALLIWRRKRIVLIGLVVAMAFAVGLLVAPGRSYDREMLRSAFVAALTRYEGTSYVWGGESRHGIDCSGLARSANIDANLRQFIRTCNPTLLREALFVWWNDCSARELGEGYKGRTRWVVNADGINDLDPGTLQPGDLAITTGGVHVLAYLGQSTWIEANPERGRVIAEAWPQPSNHWFRTPIRIVRWTEFD
jgi:hypothetical protein